MSRVENRRGFDDTTRLSLLESDIDELSDSLRGIKSLLWTLVVGFVTSGILLAINLALVSR